MTIDDSRNDEPLPRLDPDLRVSGHLAPGLEPLLEVFRDNFIHGIECGAGFAVVRDGRVLVNLVGGHVDPAGEHPWARDTLVSVYSSTKGLVALALAQLVADGELDLDARVTRYWPEFGAAGKDRVTVAQMLSHQAGLAGLRDPVTLEDLYRHDELAARMAAAEPLWPPGTAMGYHPILWGVLAGELIRRITGDRAGALLASRIAGPAGADVHLGLAGAEHHRCAGLIGPNRPWRQVPGITDAPRTEADPGPFGALANANPVIRPFGDVATPEYRRAELPAANAHATAEGLARIWAATVQAGEPLIPEGALAAARRQVVGPDQPDLVLTGRRFRRSAAGLMLNHEGIYGPDPDAFGHDGAGGSFGFADPGRRLGVGYVMNQMQVHPEADRRGRRLLEALYRALDRSPVPAESVGSVL
jgi:CubicO group peptidase (beta-lactamase class C family)